MIHRHRIRVRYGETDCMGRVYHANYLAYFECGRVELMRGWGFDYATVEKEDECFLPVTEANLTLSFDHRVLDGGAAGRLLNRVASLLRQPDKL